MKARVTWAEERTFLGESGTGNTVTLGTTERDGKRIAPSAMELLLIGTGGILLLTYPLMLAMHQPNDALILGGQIGFAILLGAFLGAGPATMAEVFPARVRVSALSVGYNICLAIFGGTTPLVSVWLIERTHDDLSMAYYLMAGALISLLVVLRLPETARRELE